MTTRHDNPYAQFNFVIDLGDAEQPGNPSGAFHEVSGIGAEIAVTEYRGTDPTTGFLQKIPGTHKFGNITLKRGVISANDLSRWLSQIRNGDPAARRSVTIRLLNEDRTAVVRSWRLIGTGIVKYTGPQLNAQGNDTAIEELVLGCEGLELE